MHEDDQADERLDEQTDAATGETVQPESPESPDEDAGPAVEPVSGDQGEWVSEQTPGATGTFDPDRPVRTSAPAPELQSGVPQPTDGSNEGVEPQPEFAGPVDPAQGEGAHGEATQADQPDDEDREQS